MNIQNRFHTIIIGAGASGLMCARSAGQRGKRILVLDHEEKVGKKILISGGGKCNFTNLNIEAGNYLSQNSHFCKSALSRFSPYDFIFLLDKYEIPYSEKEAGQLFCKKNSADVLKILLSECESANVKIFTNCLVEKIEKRKEFIVTTNLGIFYSQSIVIATGGLSLPEIGATGFGYDVAKQFGLNINAPKPGLVPLKLSEDDFKKFSELSGVSADVCVSCNGHSFTGSLLITHNGLSGPVILQISNYWKIGDEIIIDFLPNYDLKNEIGKWQKENPKATLSNRIGTVISKRLAKQLLSTFCWNKPVDQYNQGEIENIADKFHKWRILPSGTAGYKKAEVTRGGVDTNELSSKTFECKKIAGLYFIGEVLDVTGWLGGYNLHWAWASGYCAGQFV
ncbi:MAG: NAD(P)/FAD-dependent oxidoreductase [Candidatus Cloacimonadota bacterium]|nr:NAD(P)/FAD-dependent oxidoreductase [Candidatus Cloacimonadota bacterium]